MAASRIQKGKPIVLPNGTVIRKDGDGQTVIETKEQQEIKAEVEELVSDPFASGTAFVRTLADVNVDKSQFNPVMLILAYTMWGLDTHAVARYLGIDIEQVIAVKGSDLFADTRKQMLEAIRYTEADAIHGYLASKARKAAETMAFAMEKGTPDQKLAAAKDILDRSGFRPVDRTEHTVRFEDELRIVHLREADNVNIDTGV